MITTKELTTKHTKEFPLSLTEQCFVDLIFLTTKMENDAPIPLTIKAKVEAMEEEETQWTALDA
jgi:hypothetical protein